MGHFLHHIFLMKQLLSKPSLTFTSLSVVLNNDSDLASDHEATTVMVDTTYHQANIMFI